MASVLSGFADSDAWMYRADGMIVGRARDRSYKEVARGGVPIDVLVAAYGVVEPERTKVVEQVPEAKTMSPCRSAFDDYTLPLDKEDDFEQYFAPVVPRSVARARRLAAKKPAKMTKYGPKASKAHTVAAHILMEPVEPTLYAAPVKRCCGCKRAQEEGAYRTWEELRATNTCEHCDPVWVTQISAIQAEIAGSIAEIEAYEEELRAERRARDARYRD